MVRRRVLTGVVACAITASMTGNVTAAQAADRAPNLGMARVGNISIQKPGDGRKLLRFDTIIVNTGVGAFEVIGRRSTTAATQMSTSQRVYGDAGGYREVATPAVMLYDVGDGHQHWHVKDLELYELNRLDNGARVGRGAKVGYCFYDNYSYRLSLPGAPASPVYRSCGGTSSLSVITGLSIGWGDIYPSTVAGQYVDITHLPGGQYRLKVTADPSNWFVETSDADNSTWVDLQIKGNGTSFKILRYGPAA